MNVAEQKRTWRISSRLKQARAAAKEKLSQAELARRVQAQGVAKFPPAVASRIELGYTYATWQEVEALAAVLNVSPQWLAGIDETPSAPEAKGMEASKKQAKAKEPSAPEESRTIATPAGMSVAAQTRPASAASAMESDGAGSTQPAVAVAPPPTELPPLVIPQRDGLSVSDYKIKLGVERRRTEEILLKPGLPAAEWRQQREYHRALTEFLRTLIG